jgi:hypothetical protein
MLPDLGHKALDGDQTMKRLALLLIPSLLLAGQSAFAASTGDSSALALAALVAEHSQLLTHREKSVMSRMFAGNLSFTYPANKKISVLADSIVCRASNVDITSRSCELAFGAKKRALKGRQANELFATIAVAGVAPDGAAGSVFENLWHLACTIDPNVVKQKAGGGADCQFATGGP